MTSWPDKEAKADKKDSITFLIVKKKALKFLKFQIILPVSLQTTMSMHNIIHNPSFLYPYQIGKLEKNLYYVKIQEVYTHHNKHN